MTQRTAFVVVKRVGVAVKYVGCFQWRRIQLLKPGRDVSDLVWLLLLGVLSLTVPWSRLKTWSRAEAKSSRLGLGQEAVKTLDGRPKGRYLKALEGT